MKTTVQAKTTTTIIILFCCLTSLMAFNNELSFSLHCPPNQWVECDDELWDLSIYGNAYYHDYDGDHDAGEPEVIWHLDDCNTGYIKRTWSVEDPWENVHTCSQIIYVSSNDIFDESNIHWPLSGLTVEGCNPNIHPSVLPPGYGFPTWDDVGCAKPAYTFKDKTFVFSSSCKKVLREWKVIDCCQFNPNQGEGIWNYYQWIDVTDTDVPEVSCTELVEASSLNCTDAYVDLTDALTIIGENCGGGEFTVINTSPYADSNGADASGHYPIGETVFEYKVKYGCDYWKKCTIRVVVTDDKAPTPICYYGLAVALMGIDDDGDGVNEDGMIEIWASDFDKGSYLSCSGNGPLTFSFSADVDDQVRMFTCEDVGRNDIEMWVTDIHGNQSFCNTYVKVQNNAANIQDCEEPEDPNFRMVGNFSDIDGRYRENVDISLSTNIEEVTYIENTEIELTLVEVDSFINASGVLIVRERFDTTFITTIDTVIGNLVISTESDEMGNFFIYDMPKNEDYELFMEFSSDHRMYVDEHDLEALYNHLEDIELITDPYLLLAADIDDSKSIDETDLELLYQMVNGEILEFPTDHNWRCIEKDYNFKFPNTPFEEAKYFEPMRLNNVKQDIIKDFYTIKKGNLVFTDGEGGGKDNELDDDLAGRVKSKIDNISTIRSLEVSEEIGIAELLVSPNPAKDLFSIKFQLSKDEQLNLAIFNQEGQLVFSDQKLLSKGNIDWKVDLSDQNAGMYYYKLVGNESDFAGRVILIK